LGDAPARPRRLWIYAEVIGGGKIGGGDAIATEAPVLL
jgi:hypothetical protein